MVDVMVTGTYPHFFAVLQKQRNTEAILRKKILENFTVGLAFIMLDTNLD
jgi:hypothetical protein